MHFSLRHGASEPRSGRVSFLVLEHVFGGWEADLRRPRGRSEGHGLCIVRQPLDSGGGLLSTRRQSDRSPRPATGLILPPRSLVGLQTEVPEPCCVSATRIEHALPRVVVRLRTNEGIEHAFSRRRPLLASLNRESVRGEVRSFHVRHTGFLN